MSSKTSGKIVGTGLLALDLVIGADPRKPIGCWAGGTCGNVLAILAYLGWDAYPVARIKGDVAAQRVCTDLSRWGVHLDWVDCSPTARTPIIVQEIRRRADGQVGHRFSWSCPGCGQWLPTFRPITAEAVGRVKGGLAGTDVFFIDRLSRGTLTLAKEAASLGAVVAFEPSGRSPHNLVEEALEIAHVVKYAEARGQHLPEVMTGGSAVLVEIQTMGGRGLRYRHRFGTEVSRWRQLAAVRAPRLADTCGAGDWCTAGLIAKAAVGGQEGLRRGGARQVRAALRYGQTLAAWNCGFEGARGGMYAVTRGTFELHTETLRNGRVQGLEKVLRSDRTEAIAVCPACSNS